MSCLRKKCICKNCRPKVTKMTSKDAQHSARLAYAIGTLWKRIAKDFERVAEEIK